MISSSFPLVRLTPKAEARAIRHGFPWVYSNELVQDRRTKAIEPGRLVRLEDTERNPLGVIAFNPNSKIIGRVLTRNLDERIDQDWFATKIKAALAHREAMYDEPYYRLVHAETDGLPGVIIDRFGDVAVVQPNAFYADQMFDQIANALAEVTGVSTIVKNGQGRARELEGLPIETLIERGSVDGPVPVKMNGATYMADVIGGQKTGLFYDQRPNHAFAAGLAKGGKVLDVFSHVGGFGLAALAGGAASALSVDGSAPALEMAEQGAAAMGASDRYATRRGDAFDTLAAFRAEGEQFDVVICDPPAFAPNKRALEPGLRAYERVARMAAPLVKDGGYLVLCSCSHAADLQKFRGASARGIGKSNRTPQLIHTGFAGPDHPLMPQLAESGYLKSLFFRLMPE